jgi:hypothetical protein
VNKTGTSLTTTTNLEGRKTMDEISGLILKETSDLFKEGGNNKRHEQKNNFN